MSIRICYEYIKDGSSLESLLRNQYPIFRAWLQEEHETSRVEFNEQFCSEELMNFVLLNESLPEFSAITQELLDDLTTEFIAEYIGGVGSPPDLDLVEGFGSHTSTWRYMESTKLVEQYADSKANELWQYLIAGRSLKNDLPFMSGGSVYKAGFWRREEWEYLYQSLKATFGTKEQVKELFWTTKEKRQFEEDLEEAKLTNQKYIGLSDHNPITTGIECVLWALEEVEGKDVDIIFDAS